MKKLNTEKATIKQMEMIQLGPTAKIAAAIPNSNPLGVSAKH